MPINVDFTPLRAIRDLAVQAGRAEGEQRQQEIDARTAAMAMEHDTAMRRMEFQAQTQTDAQFREHQFREALQGEQLKKGLLTLEGQYGWNLKLAQAKADIALQAKIKEHAQKVSEWEARKKYMEDSDFFTPQQKAAYIMQGDLKVYGGASAPASAMTEPVYATTIYNPETGVNEVRIVPKTVGTVGQAKVTTDDIDKLLAEVAGEKTTKAPPKKKVGDIVEKAGKRWVITGFTPEGKTIVEEAK